MKKMVFQIVLTAKEKSDEEINPNKRQLLPQPSMPIKTVDGVHDS